MGLFWNAAEQRLRSGWRILIFQAAVWGLLFGPVAWSGPIARWLAAGGPSGAMLANTYLFFLLPPVMILILALVCRYVDRRPLRHRGFAIDGRWWLDLAIGAVVAFICAALVFLTEYAAGFVRISGYLARPDGVPFLLALTLSLLQFIGVGIWEEIWFRAHLVPNLHHGLSHGLGTRLATVVTVVVGGLYFGFAHIFNDNSAPAGIAALSVAGGFLAWLYWRTGSLAMPIGFHAAWDVALGPVFGFPVSGDSDDIPKLIAIQNLGGDFWTGGNFGPESGMVGWIFVPVGFALLWWRAHRSPAAAGA